MTYPHGLPPAPAAPDDDLPFPPLPDDVAAPAKVPAAAKRTALPDVLWLNEPIDVEALRKRVAARGREAKARKERAKKSAEPDG